MNLRTTTSDVRPLSQSLHDGARKEFRPTTCVCIAGSHHFRTEVVQLQRGLAAQCAVCSMVRHGWICDYLGSSPSWRARIAQSLPGSQEKQGMACAGVSDFTRHKQTCVLVDATFVVLDMMMHVSVSQFRYPVYARRIGRDVRAIGRDACAISRECARHWQRCAQETCARHWQRCAHDRYRRARTIGRDARTISRDVRTPLAEMRAG